MPHAALWVVQHSRLTSPLSQLAVSMPHAALWVVQLSNEECVRDAALCFNAARGFVGGAAVSENKTDYGAPVFQCRTRLCGWCSVPTPKADIESKEFQCRTRLCGWCSFVALSPCPPRRKKPFWKVSGNLRCLTENM